LVFHYNKQSQVLKVTSNATLLVENRALGYLYKIDLKEFTYSFTSLIVSNDITTFFQDIKSLNGTEPGTFAANRKNAYKGSKMHFIRSLYNGDQLDQGFKIISIRTKRNEEKFWIQHMISENVAKAYQENRSTGSVTLKSLANGNMDTVKYYEQVLAQSDLELKDTASIKINDSLMYDTKYLRAKLHLKDTLLIRYVENGKLGSMAQKMPLIPNRFTINNRQFYNDKKEGQLTMQYAILLLTPHKTINIYPYGGYDDGNIFTLGYMDSGKVACLLPWDYQPDNKDPSVMN
jgi:hypothetical protein